MPTNREYAEEFLRRLSDRATCDWCKHPVKPVYRTGLCQHCYDIRRKQNRLRKKIEEYKKKLGEIPFEMDDLALRYRNALADLEFRYRAAMAMEKDAKAECEGYGEMYAANIDGLNLEHQFSFISTKFVHQDLYHGDANLFDRSFTLNQKRLLSYLLSLMSRAYLRRTRWHRALNSDLYGDEYGRKRW
jgi:hypothetical protein